MALVLNDNVGNLTQTKEGLLTFCLASGLASLGTNSKLFGLLIGPTLERGDQSCFVGNRGRYEVPLLSNGV